MERRAQPADEDPEDADTVATADCSRWRNGVERQARPDAHAHQVAAGKASGAKRKHQAMTADQRAARRNEAKRLRRAQLRDAQAQAQADANQLAQQKAEDAAREAAEAAAAAAEGEEEEHAEDLAELNAMLEANGQESIDDDEYDAFCEWAERHDVPGNADTYLDWQNDADEGDAFYFDRRVDEWASGADSPRHARAFPYQNPARVTSHLRRVA